MAVMTMIRSDKDTVAKLRQRAAGKTVAGFLRDIADGGPLPADIIMEKLGKFEYMLEASLAMLKTLEQNYKHLAASVMECPDIAKTVLGYDAPIIPEEDIQDLSDG